MRGGRGPYREEEGGYRESPCYLSPNGSKPALEAVKAFQTAFPKGTLCNMRMNPRTNP